MLKNIEITLNEILAKKKLTIPKLAEKIGMSKQNLYPMIKNNDMHISTLQKICEVLEVPINYFFDEKYSILIAENTQKKKVFVQIELEDGKDEEKILKLIMAKDFINMLSR